MAMGRTRITAEMAMVLALATCTESVVLAQEVLRPVRVDEAQALDLRGVETTWFTDEAIVGVVAAARLGQGLVAIANSGAHEVLVLHEDGALLGRIGREGDGPGEFRRISDMQALSPDTVAVFDAVHQRLTAFRIGGGVAGDGEVIWSARYDVEDGVLLQEIRRLQGGIWVARSRDQLRNASPQVMRRDTVALWRGSVSGATIAMDRRTALSRVPGMWTTPLVLQGRVGYREAAFSGSALWAAYGSCVLTMEPDSPHITVTVPGVGVVAGIALPVGAGRVNEEALRAWLAAVLASTPPELRRATEGLLRDAPRPEQMPVAAALLVDDQARVWVQRWHPPLGVGGSWLVVDGGLATVRQVLLPQGGRIFEVSEGTMIVVVTDEETGVESVAIMRSGTGEASAQPVLKRLCGTRLVHEGDDAPHGVW